MAVSIGERLTALGAVAPETVQDALAEQRRTGSRIGEILLAAGELRAQQLAPLLADQWELPWLDGEADVVPEALAPEIAWRLAVVPVRIGGTVRFATAELLHPVQAEELRAAAGHADLVVTTPQRVMELTTAAYREPGVERATDHLSLHRPEASASRVVTRGQKLAAAALGAVLLLVGVLVARRRPAIELVGVLLIYVVPLLFTLGLWTLIVWTGTGDVPPWLESAPPGAGIATTTAEFALLLAPLALAVAIALAVYAPRRPDVVGGGVALLVLVPLFIAVARRAFDPGSNAGAGSLFYVILPTVAIVVTASVYAELGPRLRAVVAAALAVCLLAGSALAFAWMDDRAALPAGDLVDLLTGEPVTASLPPAVQIGQWLDANAADGQVAVAPAVNERSHQVVALMARMPDLLDAPERPPRWLVVPTGAALPGGFETEMAAGPLSVAARP